MKRIICISIFTIILVFTTACSAQQENVKDNVENSKNNDTSVTEGEQALENKDKIEENDLIKEQVEKMTLEEKIGQMLIVGFDGYSVDKNVKNMLEEHHIGGVILFSRNIESSTQLLGLINELKTANSNSETPLFISVDEEGGRVSRMPNELHKLPTSGWIGEKNDKKLAYDIGNVIGTQLNAFGFNMDFAPVLDINSNPNNPVIGNRAFGADTETVKELGIQSMKGIQESGVISVIKHFPGHGDTSTDSHIELPVVEHDINRLRDFELIPFSEAIQQGVDAVMIAHILLPKLDTEIPSSLSSVIITDILRKELNFDGVVITDDMTMGAIAENYGIGESAVKSIQAGSDIILVAHGYENALEVINSIKSSVQNREVLTKRIDESVYRILKLKEKYNLSDSTIELIDIETLNNNIDEILKDY